MPRVFPSLFLIVFCALTTTNSLAQCSQALEGQVAWDYEGSSSWAIPNLERLCRDAQTSVQPARCFEQVMHGGVNWGGGTQWQWQNAIDLCEGSRNASATIDCFERGIARGQGWQDAIAACDERNPQDAFSGTTTPVMDTTTARILGASTEPDICWKDSYGRGAGVAPSACRSGWERTGADLLCYPTCRTGFYGVGPVCWQECPAQFRNDGAFCAKPESYTRGAGFGYVPLFEERATARQRCESEHGRGNCERSLEMYYPTCREGFKPVGCCVCSPECPQDMTDIGVSCAKQSYGRGVGEGAFCQAGQEQDFQGGLCYPRCNPGTNGVGPVCWSSCPSDYPVDCGAACGVSESACAFAIMEQVQSSADVALNVAALVATAGTATPAIRAAQTAGRTARSNLSRVARRQLQDQIEGQLQNALRWQRRQANVGRSQGWLNTGQNVTEAADMLVEAYEEGTFDFMSLAPSVADVEPTGVLAVVNSFNKPICGR